ncbi:MAG: hypothetical protein H7145_12145 [Akkermansiaceae bacterium]|nr:hypothetical protein [Armatimonadota bacterium]
MRNRNGRVFIVPCLALALGSMGFATLLFPATVSAAPPQVEKTQEALEALYDARTIESRWKATARFPFGTPGVSAQSMRLNKDQPWVPFDTTASTVRGQYSLIPAAVRLLKSRAVSPKDYTEQQLNDFDTVLAAFLLASIGGRRTVAEALPTLLQATAARAGEKDSFVTRWEIMNCMVTLCGAKAVVPEIITLLEKHPDPQVRASAATTLGMSDQLLGNVHMETTPDGKHRQLLPQAALHSDLRNTVPNLAKIAATDSAPSVRLAALNALHNGIYGTRKSDWGAAFSHLTQILNKPSPSTEESRAALRVIAEAPANPRPAANAFRPYLAATDGLSRGYALVALAHVVKSGGRAAVTQWYIADLMSDEKRPQALRELETASDIAYGFGHWAQRVPGGLHYYFDNRLMNGGIDVAVLGRGNKNTSGRAHPRQLLDTLMKYGLEDKRKDARLSCARVMEKIAVAAVESQGRNPTDGTPPPPDLGTIAALLDRASDVIRTDDPALSLRLQEQAKCLRGPMSF